MNQIKYLLAIAGSVVLVIAGCHEINHQSVIAFNNVAEEGPAVDTVPKKGDTSWRRSDTSMRRTDTSWRRSDTSMRRSDTSWRRSDTSMRRTDTSWRRRSDTAMGRSDAAAYNRYIDLRTGQPVELYYDAKTRRTYSATTNEPIDFYVNSTTGDTVYGRGRYIVNNYIMRGADGMYKLDESRIRISKDEIKIKDGTKKFKMEEGKMKMKDDKQKARSVRDTTTRMRTNDTMRNQ
ncbi:hypothetical protein [Longitalea luteola]|uniref:hypothetical protein n=1 Tax=Longitalea luteola TaxID=2812563 RepID=UPI001A95B9B6|nr:hypothetical protein [Longitalea luteola]